MKTLAMVLFAAAMVSAQTPPAREAQAPSGDARRGKTLFDETYRCYACHGYEGETGSPRLVPMARSEESFLAFVRKPGTVAMPAFSDVPPKDLADLYAYLRSLHPTVPPAQNIPLLRGILEQIGQARP
jgi:mono/diheme cytochrome c family protein